MDVLNGTAAGSGGESQLEALLSTQPTVMALTLLAIIVTSFFAIEKLTSTPIDNNEPPVVKTSWIPLIGPMRALKDYPYGFHRVA